MPNPADAVADRPAVAAPGFAGLLESWRQVVLNGNLAPGRRVDAVSRWLLITRACVFPMTLTSGAIGGLLAALSAPAPHWGYFALALTEGGNKLDASAVVENDRLVVTKDGVTLVFEK